MIEATRTGCKDRPVNEEVDKHGLLSLASAQFWGEPSLFVVLAVETEIGSQKRKARGSGLNRQLG